MRKMIVNNQEQIEALVINQEQAKLRYNLGSYMVDKLAQEAQAVVHFGRRKMYIVSKMDAYMLSLAEG
ncbi:MAG: hypothetical protein MR444_00720 [Lachnospiraceae bacterium]|nr:hypothetical protein [Lachnospiraceae bacterium]